MHLGGVLQYLAAIFEILHKEQQETNWSPASTCSFLLLLPSTKASNGSNCWNFQMHGEHLSLALSHLNNEWRVKGKKRKGRVIVIHCRRHCHRYVRWSAQTGLFAPTDQGGAGAGFDGGQQDEFHKSKLVGWIAPLDLCWIWRALLTACRLHLFAPGVQFVLLDRVAPQQICFT